MFFFLFFFFFSSRRRHTRSDRDWSSDVCSSDLLFACSRVVVQKGGRRRHAGDAGDPRAGHPQTVSCIGRSEEHTSELQSRSDLVCRLLLEKKNTSDLRPAPCQRPPARTSARTYL